MHRFFPDVHDEHLYTLEKLIHAKIKELNLCIKTLMGNGEFQFDTDNDLEQLNNDNHQDNPPRQNSFQFQSQVPVKTLRCLKP